ncbi:MAG TPA: phosphatase PAP2 family protein [Chitinophagaceae bacterium]|nr:phosphatase PAP2 family protein [Chitinophagaceae bacterium]
MKKIFFLPLLLLTTLIAFSQKTRQAPPAWGHYKKLAGYSTKATNGMEAFDTLHFVLASGETKVDHIERSGGPSAEKTKAPDSKCDPASCQPGELIGNGRKRAPYYLAGAETFYIPDFPANSSQQTRAELDYLLQLQEQRTEEDVRASSFYAGVYYRTAIQPEDKDYKKFRRNLFHIGRSIGTWFNPDSLPLTAALAANVWKDAEYLIWKYKNYFIRIRPYKLESKLKNLEETNWAAYPSGHATNSYVNAYLYSELLPEFSSFFIKDAYDMAHSREIIGVHYPSDSESGRVLAWQVIKRLMSNEKFKKDFTAAKEEIEKAKAQKGF